MGNHFPMQPKNNGTVQFIDKVSCEDGWLVGWLDRFYGISTHVGYFMPNPAYTYIRTYIFNTYILLVVWVLWHINLCRLFNAKSILALNNQFYFKQFSLACVLSLIVKNISISSYSFYSNSSNSAHSVLYKYRFSLHTVKCQNTLILNNSV